MNDEDEIDGPTVPQGARRAALLQKSRAPESSNLPVLVEQGEAAERLDRWWLAWQRRQLPQLEVLLLAGFLLVFIGQTWTLALVFLLVVVTLLG